MLSIYELPDRYFIHAISNTEAGFSLATLPTGFVLRNVSDAELGVLVLNILNSSSNLGVVPTPQRDQYAKLTQTILKDSGLKSWMTIQRVARLCNVIQIVDVMRIIPTRNGGAKGDEKGFSDLEEKSLSLELIAPADCGAQLRRAFDLCE